MKKTICFYIIFLLVSEIIIRNVFKPPIMLVSWGPKKTKINVNFNGGENDNSTIWVTTNKLIPLGSYMMWGNNKIKTTISENDPLITANIDKELYSKKGVFFIQIISPETNEFSNKIPFIVY
jgi:hypothetical protein